MFKVDYNFCNPARTDRQGEVSVGFREIIEKMQIVIAYWGGRLCANLEKHQRNMVAEGDHRIKYLVD